MVNGEYAPEENDFSFGADASVRPGGGSSDTSGSPVDPETAWSRGAVERTWVALPWTNDGYPQNFADWDGSAYAWSETTGALSWQPYLLYLVKAICREIEYDCDLRPWEENEGLSYLLVCNCLPATLGQSEFAKALPHWSVSEFFEKLEMLLGGRFDIDHRGRAITFKFDCQLSREAGEVRVDWVFDTHSTTVQVESPSCDYIATKNLKYADADNPEWNYLSCPWLIERVALVASTNAVRPPGKVAAVAYDTVEELLEKNRGLRTWSGGIGRNTNLHQLMYARDMDVYFVCRSWYSEQVMSPGTPLHNLWHCVLQPVNTLGPRIVDKDSDQEEIEFVPVPVQFTEPKYGRCFSLNVSDDTGGEVDTLDRWDSEVEDYKTYLQRQTWKTSIQNAIENGDPGDKGEYFGKIYVGHWDGAIQQPGKLPFPNVENIVIADDWESYVLPRFSLRLNDIHYSGRSKLPEIDPGKKTTFSFLAGDVESDGCQRGSIPNPRALFHIRGKRYVCEKLTATFTEEGMSEMIKGVFYPVKD